MYVQIFNFKSWSCVVGKRFIPFSCCNSTEFKVVLQRFFKVISAKFAIIHRWIQTSVANYQPTFLLFTELLKKYEKGCDALSSTSTPQPTPSKRGRRGQNTQNLQDQREPTLDSVLEAFADSVVENSDLDNDDDDDDDESSEGGEVEETAREQRLMVRQRVNDLLALRMPLETFVQDAPCFQVMIDMHTPHHE